MAFDNTYSRLDRALHRLAFGTWTAQEALSDLEESLFADDLAKVRVERPVFVTGLPRAGTTLLLEVLVDSGEFASHTYRDMPFVLVPLLWGRYSRSFARTSTQRERAHGDGMLVGLDSPEAFEEIIWRQFWRGHYLMDRVVPWDADRNIEFEDFMLSHLRKILFLRGGEFAVGSRATLRYVSKNNLNIARVAYLNRMFGDATVVVPFRDPLQQAASLQRQHINFLEIHGKDPFARRYMEAIGHYDFGSNLRPVDFGGWIDSAGPSDPQSLQFWLRYWCAAYGSLLQESSANLHFVSYDHICAEPRLLLARLGTTIGIKDSSRLIEQSARFVQRESARLSNHDVPQAILEAAIGLHAQLVEQSDLR